MQDVWRLWWACRTCGDLGGACRTCESWERPVGHIVYYRWYIGFVGGGEVAGSNGIW